VSRRQHGRSDGPRRDRITSNAALAKHLFVRFCQVFAFSRFPRIVNNHVKLADCCLRVGESIDDLVSIGDVKFKKNGAVIQQALWWPLDIGDDHSRTLL
jgi:hypothetical protein